MKKSSVRFRDEADVRLVSAMGAKAGTKESKVVVRHLVRLQGDSMPKKTIEIIEKKFREIGLDDSDRTTLRSLLVFSQDISELESAIYMYAYSFTYDLEVERVCERFCSPEFWEPGLTSVCLKALIRYWNKEPIDYKQTIDDLMNADEEIWYDEIIFLRHIKRSEYVYAPTQF